ncbi:RNA binding protein [Oryctes borbonicus]|uniref:RNA binding protein n=1 Tax=Oryctes borbonicus TaxID=1629725 RepID=A0A0T6AZH9_9SCAR|nr:RNA binding protein [Oryctes borbonicus]
METDMLLEEQNHKRGRQRKKQLYNSVMHQMEFYFSDSNLTKDKFLLPLVQKDPDVDIEIFLKFNKIRKLTTNIEDIVKAINNSQLLTLSEDKNKVRRNTPINMKENADNCTLYVEGIKVDATHESLTSVFSEFGNVTYVSIPKYKHNKVNKGFAFVEFEQEQDAADALNYFETIGCRMSSLIAPETLCSIVTYEANHATERVDGSKCIEDEDKQEIDLSKKRKHDTDECEKVNKKIKVDNIMDDVENVQNGDYEDKKRKKHKKMRKKIFKELGLQVLSKLEWKKIRNRYLDNQKAKMKQLKQFLHKKRFTNHTDAKQKGDLKNMNGNHSDANVIATEKHIQELTFVPGVIVKIQLLEPYQDVKQAKDALKQRSADIKFVDIPMHGSAEVYLRFADSTSAQRFRAAPCDDYVGRPVILEGKEEEDYWHKIVSDRTSKLEMGRKRTRGREKLLKRAEKELGKHIRFDDAD